MKKIGIIGTSNSVTIGGYIDALKFDFEVVNFSSGRVPVFYHIRTFLNYQSLLSDCDYILIDHYVNDYNFYDDNLGPDYIKHIKNFYLMLNSLNKPVINIFFPILNINDHRRYYDDVLKLSNGCGFYSLNLNKYNFESTHFTDAIHLLKEVSFFVGLELSNYLDNNHLKPFYRNSIDELQYYLVSAADISSQTSVKLHNFNNTLMSFDYVNIDSYVNVRVKENSFLLSIGYYNPESYISYSVCIDGNSYTLPGVKYFHESIISNSLSSSVHLSPVPSGVDVKCLMDRGPAQQSDSLSCANIVELLMFSGFSEEGIVIHPLAPMEVELDLSSGLKGMFPINSRLITESDINAIRDAATEIGEKNLNLSVELMSIAKRARPTGPYIIKKYNELSLLKKLKLKKGG
ncbi:MAG: hypothetical protein ACJAS9_002984 [Polaribacter sp.]|jgi:hypothetical protein